MSKLEIARFDLSLESWARQGVLLLNSSLTVEINKPNSHTALWFPFMTEFLKNLSEITGMIYVLFGEQAKNLIPYIGPDNLVLYYKHPAYFARLQVPMECDCFRKINESLTNYNNTKINWYESM
jgi:uracil-DNA glycosylase